MNTRNQMFCLWCGPLGILFWLVGFWLVGGLIPPPSPNAGAQEIQSFYQHNTDGIRAGLLLTMVGASLTAPWVASISTQLKRVEGRNSPLTYLQLGTGMLGILLFIFPVMSMQAAAFRPDRDPQLILLLNDLGWIPFVGAWSLAFLQNLAIGLAALQDREQKVLPRWFGYYNLWSIVLFIPGSLLYFVKTGPFAWDGALSWWLVVVDFILWFAVTFLVMRRAVKTQGPESRPAGEAAPAEHGATGTSLDPHTTVAV